MKGVLFLVPIGSVGVLIDLEWYDLAGVPTRTAVDLSFEVPRFCNMDSIKTLRFAIGSIHHRKPKPG